MFFQFLLIAQVLADDLIHWDNGLYYTASPEVIGKILHDRYDVAYADSVASKYESLYDETNGKIPVDSIQLWKARSKVRRDDWDDDDDDNWTDHDNDHDDHDGNWTDHDGDSDHDDWHDDWHSDSWSHGDWGSTWSNERWASTWSNDRWTSTWSNDKWDNSWSHGDWGNHGSHTRGGSQTQGGTVAAAAASNTSNLSRTTQAAKSLGHGDHDSWSESWSDDDSWSNDSWSDESWSNESWSNHHSDHGNRDASLDQTTTDSNNQAGGGKSDLKQSSASEPSTKLDNGGSRKTVGFAVAFAAGLFLL